MATSQPNLWALKFSFHIIFTSENSFSQPFKNCKNHSHLTGLQKQAAGWFGPAGHSLLTLHLDFTEHGKPKRAQEHSKCYQLSIFCGKATFSKSHNVLLKDYKILLRDRNQYWYKLWSSATMRLFKRQS